MRIAVDDFGTSYSSLSYQQRFPLDMMKLDRAFLTEQHASDASIRSIHAFLDLAHALNLSVVSEGIETPAMLAQLRETSCGEG